jgi:hypothetical protein
MNKKKTFILIFLFLAVIGTAGGYWFKQKYDELLAATSKGLALGKAYGKSISQTSCLDGLKFKYSSCSTTECELSATGFITGCMKTAKKDNFCTELPNVKETQRSLSWVEKTCSQSQPGNSKCLKYMHNFIGLCTEQTENRTMTNFEHFQNGFKKGLEKQSSQRSPDGASRNPE